MASQNIDILIKAKDEASANIKKVTDSFSWLKTIALSAITALWAVEWIKASIQAMNDQVRVNTQLEAVLKSTWNAVWLTSETIQKMASDLQWMTTIQDDAIQAWQNMLLTFTNIGGEVFPEATRTLLDMATAMNSGATPSAETLSAQAIQLWKALNDPIMWISALSRVGVTFTEWQKEMIKGMVESWNTMQAQKIILAELNREFGGSAQAQAQTFSWKMQQLSNSISDVAEIIWFALLPALTYIADNLKVVALQAVQFFNDNSKAIMEFANWVLVFFKSIIGTIYNNLTSAYQIINQVFEWIFWNAKQTWTWVSQIFKFLAKAIAMGFQTVSVVVSVTLRAIIFGVNYLVNKVREMFLWVTQFLWDIITGWALIFQGIINTIITGINWILEKIWKSTIEFATFWTDLFDSFSKEMQAQNADLTKEMGDDWNNFSQWVASDIWNAVANMEWTMGGFDEQIKGTEISLKWLALNWAMWMGGVAEATKKAWKATEDLKKLWKETSDALQGVFSALNWKIDTSKSRVATLKDEYKKLGEQLKTVGQEWVKALWDIQKKLEEHEKKMKDISGSWKTDVATRLIEAQKELADLNKSMAGGSSTSEDATKKAKLEAEIALGMASTTESERSMALVESEKSQIQLIIDKTNQKMADAVVERDEIQKTYNAKVKSLNDESTVILGNMNKKQLEIKKEEKLYKSLIDQRKMIEEAYFTAFNKSIEIQMDKTRQAIDLLSQLTRMWWGGLAQQITYETFSAKAPSQEIIAWTRPFANQSQQTATPPITVNMWWVAINNGQDAKVVGQTIADTLQRQLQLYKLWIN